MADKGFGFAERENVGDQGNPGEPSAEYDIMFDVSKRESHNPKQGFKKLTRKLKSNFKLQVNKDEIASDLGTQTKLLVFGNPREKFTPAEFDAMKKYVSQGGSLLFMLSDVDGKDRLTNINFFLEEYGISVKSDAVVRTVYFRYHHPKEVLVNNGVISKELILAGSQIGQKGDRKKNLSLDPLSRTQRKTEEKGLDFVFPYGSSLDVKRPAVPILTSGFIAYPLNRAVAAVYEAMPAGAGKKPGRIAVVGSADMFADEFLEKEENQKIQQVLFQWLMGSTSAKLEKQDADAPDLSEPHKLPDTEQLSERLRSCLQDSEEVPKDFMKLFDEQLFRFDTKLIPETVRLYDQLNVKHEPLSLILPQFEMPLPPLHAAIFPPTIREPPPPALDQFDLDEHFASERLRLAQLTNKCSEDDLDYFIKESGEILGVTAQLQPEERTARHVLEFIFKKVVNFKKLNQEGPAIHGQEGDYRPSTAAGLAAATSMTMPDYRPDTASAIKAAQESEFSGGALGRVGIGSSAVNGEQAAAAEPKRSDVFENSDVRPDTASAIKAVESKWDARPDTAAALAAVEDLERREREGESGGAKYGK